MVQLVFLVPCVKRTFFKTHIKKRTLNAWCSIYAFNVCFLTYNCTFYVCFTYGKRKLHFLLCRIKFGYRRTNRRACTIAFERPQRQKYFLIITVKLFGQINLKLLLKPNTQRQHSKCHSHHFSVNNANIKIFCHPYLVSQRSGQPADNKNRDTEKLQSVFLFSVNS